MFKQNNNKAQMHHKKMQMQYKQEIAEAISCSTVYHNDLQRYEYDSKYDEYTDIKNIEIVQQTTSDAIFKNDNEHWCALNFASFKHPGGGYMNGSIAQEESLCHESILYNVIGSDAFKSEYQNNLNHLNNGLYENFAIFSPNIIFHRENKEVQCDIITCPAPNYREYSKHNGSLEKNIEILKDRIEFIMNVAIDNDCDNLILGAWGCGVFMQDAKIVAELFKQLLKNYKFKKVIFAIPDNKNYNIFKQVYEKY